MVLSSGSAVRNAVWQIICTCAARITTQATEKLSSATATFEPWLAAPPMDARPWKETVVRARRCIIILLGPGLFASLALSPGLATQASAAPAAAQAPMTGVAFDNYVGQPEPDPDTDVAYSKGLHQGFALGYKVGQQDADEGRRDPRRLSPYSFGNTRLEHGRYNGFIAGYNAGVVTNPFKLTEEMGRQAEREAEQRQSQPQEEDPEEEPVSPPEGEHEPANPPAEEPVGPPEGGNEPEGGHEQQ